MIHLPQTLPLGALLGKEGESLSATGPLWFAAAPDAVVRDGDAITGWRATSGVVAEATQPNQGNSRFDAGRFAAFRCETGVHCGFGLRHAVKTAERFTLAVIWSTEREEARSLAALSTGQANNVIFLTESEGRLIAKDRGNAVEVGLAAPKAGPSLAVLSYDGKGLSLRSGGQTVTAKGTAADMDRPADLFLGCRSNRSGLAKTLGAARLHDVLLWPDRVLVGSEAPEDLAALASLDRYHRWTY